MEIDPKQLCFPDFMQIKKGPESSLEILEDYLLGNFHKISMRR